jgi:hypothetical protein
MMSWKNDQRTWLSRFVKLMLVSSLSVLNTGCLSQHLKNAGEHEVQLIPEVYLVNDQGQMVLACDAWDKEVNSGKRQSLGKRYICASSQLWEEAAQKYLHYHCSGMCRTPHENEDIHYKARISEERAGKDELFQQRFILYPPDLRTQLEPELPFPKSGWEPLINEEGRPYYLYSHRGGDSRVYVSLKGYDNQYVEWWWLPNQVIARPVALVADTILLLPVYVPVGLISVGSIGQ